MHPTPNHPEARERERERGKGRKRERGRGREGERERESYLGTRDIYIMAILNKISGQLLRERYKHFGVRE